MAEIVSVRFTGINDFVSTLTEIKEDFNEKDSKKILNRAIRLAMAPVLSTAKSLVRKDTGALEASLRIEVRKPNSRDKKSVYVNPTDIVIGTVTTAPANVLAKKRFQNRKNTTSKIKQIGIESDARAIANEFGTANMAARPFMRPAMESSAQVALDSLAGSLRTALEKYRSKNTK